MVRGAPNRRIRRGNTRPWRVKIAPDAEESGEGGKRNKGKGSVDSSSWARAGRKRGTERRRRQRLMWPVTPSGTGPKQRTTKTHSPEPSALAEGTRPNPKPGPARHHATQKPRPKNICAIAILGGARKRRGRVHGDGGCAADTEEGGLRRPLKGSIHPGAFACQTSFLSSGRKRLRG